ncbi:Lrp/AsnC family transcriptional regulator [Chelatococcus sp. GCM10030263]|uniref:Lrp/AsnC family transcriptional regulator n=1 Tax=Chelatococcus sp. GCM10030263 TaxID=3273387 RepID=UPI003617D9A8
MPSESITPSAELDNYDIAILKILQVDNTVPQRVIGEKVHLSAAAVQRRIRRMEDDGVIIGHVALVDPVRVGRPITIVVEVDMESEQAVLLDAAKKSFLADPDVQQCYYVAGDADFVLIVTVASMDDYQALTRRLFFNNANVKRFRTLVVMDKIKAALSVPVGGRP